jgi:uncharacterized protein YjbI with pentapeptide repeats
MLIVNESGEALCEFPADRHSFEAMNLRGAQMANMDLHGAYFNETDLTAADLEGGELYWAIFDGVICDKCNFKFACLRGARFWESSFAETDFRGADFSNDNLDGVTDLSLMDLSTALLDGALYTDSPNGKHTIFPPDFDPVARGMKVYAGPPVH